VGAADKLNSYGERLLLGVEEVNLDRQRILNFVNAACEPSLEDIGCEVIDIDGKSLMVITVLQTPYLHETTRELAPQSGKFNKHVVFVRHNESIDIASAQERDAIVRLKRIRFDERRNPPPAPFGAVVGGSIGGLIAYALGRKIPGKENAAPGAAIAVSRHATGMAANDAQYSLGYRFHDLRYLRWINGPLFLHK
jgi:hypothetical protein